MTYDQDGYQSVAKDIGGILLLLGLVMAAPLAVSLLYGEWYTALSFFISATVAAGVGYFAYSFFQHRSDIHTRHAMITAASAWTVTSIFGALPFFVAAHITPPAIANSFVPHGTEYSSSLYYFTNYLHALFESVSAFTTTGLTMSVHEPTIGHGLLFYRSFAQWLGGAGMIVLSLAVLKQPVGMKMTALYGVEFSGDKIRPSIKTTVRSIWRVYLAVTLLSTLYIFFATWLVSPDYGFLHNLFDAINHAMTGQSTGGFSTYDDSISGYNSFAMEMIYLVPMILGAVSMPIYYRIYEQRSIKALWHDYQGRWLLLLAAGGSIVLMMLLWGRLGAVHSLRQGFFQFVSAITTTGWQTVDFNTWPLSATLFVALVPMVIGGCAGATVGGIKISRAYLMGKGVGWRLKRYFQPSNSILAIKINEKRHTYNQISDDLMEAFVFTGLYLALLFAGIILSAQFMDPGFHLVDAIFESTSAQGTVGLSSGITRPDMSPVLEVTYILQMLIGRLELIPVMIMLQFAFNRKLKTTH